MRLCSRRSGRRRSAPIVGDGGPTWTMWGRVIRSRSVGSHIKFAGTLGTAPGSTAVGSDNRASILFDPDVDAVDGR